MQITSHVTFICFTNVAYNKPQQNQTKSREIEKISIILAILAENTTETSKTDGLLILEKF